MTVSVQNVEVDSQLTLIRGRVQNNSESGVTRMSVEWRRMPWGLLVCAVALMAVGLSGIARADELNPGPDLFSKQVTWTLVSLMALVGVTAIPYRMLRPISYGLFLASLPLLVIVLFMAKRNGARCWIQLGFFDLQPSEFVKLTFILALSQYLMYRENHRRWYGLTWPLTMTLVPLGLILLEPDLGSALLFVPVLFAMLFAAGARPVHLVCVSLIGLALSPVFWTRMSAEQKSRITALFSQVDGGRIPEGDRRHQHQSKLVLAQGGLWGSTFAGRQLADEEAYRLPASRTDFVFCMVCERWGLLGGLFTLMLYVILFGSGLWIAASTREPFGRLMAVGIVTVLAAQAIINTGMTVGLLPVVGITLPLMSYGGSSLVMTAVSLGLLINVGLRPGYEISSAPFQFER